jgi:hypothetical protein
LNSHFGLRMMAPMKLFDLHENGDRFYYYDVDGILGGRSASKAEAQKLGEEVEYAITTGPRLGTDAQGWWHNADPATRYPNLPKCLEAYAQHLRVNGSSRGRFVEEAQSLAEV